MDTNKLNMINYLHRIRDEIYRDAVISNPDNMFMFDRQLDIIVEYLKDIIKKSDVVYSCDKAKLSYRNKMEFLWDYQQNFNHHYQQDFEKRDMYDDLCR